MIKIQQTLYKIRIPMLILLPLWVAIGRVFFGAGGWLVLATLFIAAPLIFAGLLTTQILTRRVPEIKKRQRLPKVDSFYLLVVYISFFLFGFMIEDGGDVNEGSTATKLFGLQSSGALDTIGQLALWVGIISLVGYIAYCVRRLKHGSGR